MIIDSHCHPQFPEYKEDRDEMIRRALDQGIFMIAVGTDLDSSRSAVELSQKYDGIWATVGLHPNEVGSGININEYKNLLVNNKIVAIGEVGLDYYRTTEIEKQEIQKDVFREFINLSHSRELPLVIHSRDAKTGSLGRVHSDILDILSSSPNSHHGIVIHSFTGTIADAGKYLEIGAYLGFNGIITFSDQYNDIVQSVPLDRILIETDAPYLTPEPNRGQRNEPAYVTEVAKKIAVLKNSTFETVINLTTLNAKSVFKIS